MKKKNLWSKITAITLTMVMLFSFATMQAGAAKAGELTITKTWDDDTFAPTEVLVDIYRAVLEADIDEDDELDAATPWQTVTLKSAESWTKTVDLDDADTLFFYRAKARPITDYDTTTSGATQPSLTQSSGLVWEAPKPGLPFGGAHRFSVFAFGNFITNRADVEGGIAVGGNLDTTDTTTYAFGRPDVFIGKPIEPHNPRLIVGGELKIDQMIQVTGGNVLVNNLGDISFIDTGWNAIRLIKYIGSAPTYSSDSSPSDFAPSVDWRATDGETALVQEAKTGEIANFFSLAQTQLTALSSDYKNTVADANTTVHNIDYADELSGGLDIDAIGFLRHSNLHLPVPEDGKDRVVYNVTIREAITPFNDVEITMPAGFTGDIVINFLTEDVSIEFGSSSSGARTTIAGEESAYYDGSYPTARLYSDRIFWNFPNDDLTTIYSNGFSFFGSVLAPYSSFIAKDPGSAGNVNGTLVALNVDVHISGGWETHNTAGYDNVTYPGGTPVSSYNATLALASVYDAPPTTTPPVTSTPEPSDPEPWYPPSVTPPVVTTPPVAEEKEQEDTTLPSGEVPPPAVNDETGATTPPVEDDISFSENVIPLSGNDEKNTEDLPNTGDYDTNVFAAIASLISLIGMTALCLYEKRHQTKRHTHKR